MKPVCSLAEHLVKQAAATPDAPALIVAGQRITWQQLLIQAEQLAAKIPAAPEACTRHGSSLDLALHAYACSLKNRAFWPVDRNNSPAQQILPAADTALIISTSGSEGVPKAVMLSQRNLDAAACAANQRLPLHAGDLWLDCLPLYHIGGLSILWRCAQAGATVLLHEGFDLQQVADDLNCYPLTHISLVPAMLARLLEIGAQPPASLRHAIIGGAALTQALYQKASSAGWPLNPSYGMSESSAQIATWTAADGPWHEGLVGTALTGSELALTDDGRIKIRGPQVMLGYLGQTAQPSDDWFITSDLGKIAPDKQLTVSGRADDMLISGGRNIHPSEVESCLAACPGIDDVAVTGQPDPVWGDLLVALVVSSKSREEISQWCRTRLPSAAWPRRIIHLSKLPRNACGKLERSALRRLANESAA